MGGGQCLMSEVPPSAMAVLGGVVLIMSQAPLESSDAALEDVAAMLNNRVFFSALPRAC